MARCQAEVDSEEFAWWLAYYQTDPFGERRADLRAATTSAVIANCNRGEKQRPFTAGDFMPDFGEQPEPEPDADLIKAKLMYWANLHNTRERDKK